MQKTVYWLYVFIVCVSWNVLLSKNAYIIDLPNNIDQCFHERVNNDLRCWYDAFLMKQALEASDFTVQFISSSTKIVDPDVLIWFDTSHIDLRDMSQFAHVVKVMMTRETSMIIPSNFDELFLQNFDIVGTWHDDYVDNQKYFKIYYPVALPMIDYIVPFAEKKLCTLIAGYKKVLPQLYEERQKAIEFFERFHANEFDFYGKDWEKSRYTRYKTYKGKLDFDKKIDCLKQYKFCICFENSRYPGYITEKIFDCFQAGCVPVYLGAPNVEQYIPRNCFISFTRFKNYKELYRYLSTMDEAVYDNYLSNIKEFLNGQQAYFFTGSYYKKTCEYIAEIFNKKLVNKSNYTRKKTEYILHFVP